MTAPDPLEGQVADMELIRTAVLAEVDHCAWASTGGYATGTPEEKARTEGAKLVREYLTRGGLNAALLRVVADPRLGEWKRHLDWWAEQ